MPSFGDLADRDRRALLIAVATITGLVGIRVLPAMLQWRNTEVERSRLRIVGITAAPDEAQRARVLRDSLVARRVRLALLDSAFVPTEGNASAAEGLAEFLTGASERAKVVLSTVRLESAPDSGAKAPIGGVRLRAAVSADLAGIARLLMMIERPPLVLAIRQLSMTQRDPNVPHDKNETLDAEIVIDGLVDNRSTIPTSRPSR
jgi:hypothetical protein